MSEIQITNWAKLTQWNRKTEYHRTFIDIDYMDLDKCSDFEEITINNKADMEKTISKFAHKLTSKSEVRINAEDEDCNTIDNFLVEFKIASELQKKEMELAQPMKALQYTILNVKSVSKSFVRKYDNVFVYDTKEYRYAIFAGKTATAVTLRGRTNSVFQENKVDWSKATKYKVLRFPSATPEEVKAYLETKEGQEELVYNAYE